jgi:ABC-type branched-subunit amino acid transport system permease subunit
MTALDTRELDAPAPARDSWLDPRLETLLKRLLWCLFGGFVLAVMYGTQEGSQNDFGISFHEAMTHHLLHVPRIIIFLAIGVVIFALITFWGVLKQYAKRPGVLPLGAAFVVVLVAQAIMNWYDPKADAAGASKFSLVRKLVDESGNQVQQTTTLFFDGWLSWAVVVVGILIGGVAIITRIRPLGYATTACGVAGAIFAWLAHSDVVSVGGGFDHSLGVYADVIGFLVLAAAGVIIALSTAEAGDWRGFLARAMDFRPGLPLAALGLVLGLLSYGRNCWFAPVNRNLDFSASGTAYKGSGISSLASQYLDWLGWTSFLVVAGLAVAATVLRNRLLGWLAAATSVVGIAITMLTLKSMTEVAAKDPKASQFGSTWNNLGAGGFTACISFGLFGGAAVYVVARRRARANPAAEASGVSKLPVTQAIERARRSANVKALIVVALAVALFYPPTLSLHWQTVLVTEMSVYLLLAVGLNVVVGWAGLLDLGYIAFYAVGAYTTAYFTGALPRKPPSWLHLTPLLTIPFAIVACLIAGVLLGAPTLRLRGDYLAIVTLGFGEIIQEIAINNPGNITNGPQGIQSPVPHPVLHIGSFKITWGQDNLPYWYLLLVMLIIVVVLFYRLENSRIGRAWAAIREDEVAAQASGINTVRAKLLAFAIGASTSALAGSFFASQIGFFDPSLFTVFASILIVAYVVFGGMGSLAGAMAGAAVLTWLPEFLKSQVPTDDRQMWVGALVLLMMIFRPAGLLPAKRRRAELSHLDEGASGEVSAVPRAGAV